MWPLLAARSWVDRELQSSHHHTLDDPSKRRIHPPRWRQMQDLQPELAARSWVDRELQSSHHQNIHHPSKQRIHPPKWQQMQNLPLKFAVHAWADFELQSSYHQPLDHPRKQFCHFHSTTRQMLSLLLQPLVAAQLQLCILLLQSHQWGVSLGCLWSHFLQLSQASGILFPNIAEQGLSSPGP